MNKDIKIMRQICERLVTKSEEFPTIALNAETHIEVSGFSLYYRLDLLGLQSPIKLRVRIE